MNQQYKQLSTKQKMHILFGTLAGLGVGGVLGIIAYYQHWLGLRKYIAVMHYGAWLLIFLPMDQHNRLIHKFRVQL